MTGMETIHPVETRPRLRGPWVEVDLRVLDENLRKIRASLKPATEPIFVVKANAYGHGMVPVAVRAAAAGVRWFAVAYLDEAVRLREALPDARILVLGVVDPVETERVFTRRIIPIVSSEPHGRQLAVAARALGVEIPVHLKIDTGMNRLGIPWETAPAVRDRLAAEPGLRVEGLCSHFATVVPGADNPAAAQYERFSRLAESGDRNWFRHLSSSRAFLLHPEWDFDGVRVGIAPFGYGTQEKGMRVRTRPVLQWKTSVIQVKRVPAGAAIGYYGTYITPGPTTLAVLAVGYADGYLRTLSNRGLVLIRGRKYRVVGRVSMNWVTVDVGPDSPVVEGDEAVLVGAQGSESIWADRLAAQCRTIAYEILTGIYPSAERKYLE
jgi:alanine racemase